MAGSSPDLSSPPSDTEVKAQDVTQTKSRKRGSEAAAPASAKRAKRASRGPQPKYTEHSEDEETEQVTKTSPKKRGKGRSAAIKKEVEVKVEVEEVAPNKKAGTQPKTTAKVEVEKKLKIEEDDEEQEDTITKKTPKKRTTKKDKEAEMIPLASRTVGHKLFVGAHVSAAGGVQNAVVNSVHIGGNAFALFMKSQRKWANPPLAPEAAKLFKSHCEHHKYDSAKHVVPHGSYLVNLAHTDPTRAKQAYDAFLDDLTRCHELGIQLYNFHPGNAASSTREEALKQLATQLNRAHKDPTTGTVITLLETMAAFDGNTIGGTFEELRAVIDQIDAKDRVGVCLDTCHVFAAGYDLRTPAALSDVLDKFDETVGLEYLRALHVNDSKAPLSSGRDLHANIGTGFLGLRAFHALVNEPRILECGLPFVLETPIDAPDPENPKKKVEDKGVWAREIKLLENLVGMDAESEEFKTLEEKLQEKGKGERERVQEQVNKREGKKKAKAEKDEVKKTKQATLAFGAKKKKGGKKEESEGSDEES